MFIKMFFLGLWGWLSILQISAKKLKGYVMMNIKGNKNSLDWEQWRSYSVSTGWTTMKKKFTVGCYSADTVTVLNPTIFCKLRVGLAPPLLGSCASSSTCLLPPSKENIGQLMNTYHMCFTLPRELHSYFFLKF
jgi:hypothetical protein